MDRRGPALASEDCVEQQIAQLKDLRKRGVISEGEYALRRQLLLLNIEPRVEVAAKQSRGLFKRAGIGCGVLVVGGVADIVIMAAAASRCATEATATTTAPASLPAAVNASSTLPLHISPR